ncbi:MAG: hypothetical protein GX640_24715, partial [Fibrobacter sp.]|nr:hypothetical protein [Fibrobacter sp.]
KARKAQKSERKHINRSRLRELGYTNDLREAGYITPIGKLIDLSGKREGGQPGTRSYDHREMGGTLGMQEFMDEGNIRMDYSAGSFDIAAMPTSAQLKIVRKIAAEKNGEITLDLWEGLGEQRESYYLEPSRVFSVQYREGTKPSKIINDIKTFYAGEMPSKTLFRKSDPTNTPAFKEWFGNSKVVDENGKPLVMYHWTDYEFDSFDMEAAGGLVHVGTKQAAWDRARGMEGINYEIEEEDDGFWVFADSGPTQGDGQGPFKSESEAKAFIKTQPKKIEPLALYVKIENPLRVKDLGMWPFDAVRSYLSRKNIITDKEADAAWKAWQKSDRDGWKTLKDIIRKHGYDGFVYTNEMEDPGSDSYIALEPTQLKSIDNQGTFDPENPNILMRKGKPSGIPIPTIKTALEPITAKWKGAPKIVVTESKDTKIPKGLMRQMGDAEGVAGAFYDDTVYLFHDNIDSIEDAQKTILHESAHWGPRRMFGRSFDRFLRVVLRSADKGVLDKVAKLYDCDMTKVPDRMLAAEEYVAHISETGQDAKTWNRFTSYVKQWLIKRGFTVKLSDDEIRAIVSRGRTSGTGTVFTKDGRMRTAAYHGSPHTFDKFSTEKIGTGEGFQAYGYGLYFAGKKEVAEYYKNTLSRSKNENNGVFIDDMDLLDYLDAKHPEFSPHEADRIAYHIQDAISDSGNIEDAIKAIETNIQFKKENGMPTSLQERA